MTVNAHIEIPVADTATEIAITAATMMTAITMAQIEAAAQETEIVVAAFVIYSVDVDVITN